MAPERATVVPTQREAHGGSNARKESDAPCGRVQNGGAAGDAQRAGELTLTVRDQCHEVAVIARAPGTPRARRSLWPWPLARASLQPRVDLEAKGQRLKATGEGAAIRRRRGACTSSRSSGTSGSSCRASRRPSPARRRRARGPARGSGDRTPRRGPRGRSPRRDPAGWPRRPAPARPLGAACTHVRGQRLRQHHRRRLERHGALDDVLQLAHVAGPVVGLEQRLRLLRNATSPASPSARRTSAGSARPAAGCPRAARAAAAGGLR